MHTTFTQALRAAGALLMTTALIAAGPGGGGGRGGGGGGGHADRSYGGHFTPASRSDGRDTRFAPAFTGRSDAADRESPPRDWHDGPGHDEHHHHHHHPAPPVTVGTYWGDVELDDMGGSGFARTSFHGPGADLLRAYDLEQTDCSNERRVVIEGLPGGPICARPNGVVPPGHYTITPDGTLLQPN
jgi:hypothetical protein